MRVPTLARLAALLLFPALALCGAFEAGAQALLWRTTVSGPLGGPTGNSVVGGAVRDHAGNLIVTGGSGNTWLTAKIDATTHQVLWTRTNTGFGAAVAVDSADNVYVGGQVGLFGAGRLIKYGADGTDRWSIDVHNSGLGSGIVAVAVGPDDHPVHFNNNDFGSGNFGAQIFKRDKTDGHQLWGGANDRPVAMAMDANGDIVTLNSYLNFPDNMPAVSVTKYAKQGSPLGGPFTRFRKFITSPNGVRMHALALDAAGDAIIAGENGADGNSDIRVMKILAGTNNQATAWDITRPSAPGRADSATAVTTDAQGDVFVAGRMSNGTSDELAVFKFAGANGTLRWGNTMGTPAGNYSVKAATVNTAGDLVVVGDRLAATQDLVTARFSTVNGQLRWADIYDNAGGSEHGDSLISIPGALYVFGDASASASPDRSWVISKLVDGYPSRPLDFSGDLKSDLLWRNNDGRVAIWLMNGLASTFAAEIFPAGTAWQVAQAVDLDGDGKRDLIWQNPDGRITAYLMDGTTTRATQNLLAAGGGWTATQAGDLDGDGKADIVFTNVDGRVAAWTMDGLTMTSGATLLDAGSGWSVLHLGDFDGDGKQDLLWKHADGRHAIWLMDGINVNATAEILGAGGWTAIQVGDLDGNGKADIVWRHTNGTLALWLMDDLSVAAGATLLGAGSGWTVARVGDFNGDGRADLFFQHTDGRAAIYLMNGLSPTATAQILNAGGGWSARRLQDMNGDGKADIVWENTDGRVAVWLMNGTSLTSGAGILAAGTGWRVSAASP